MGHPASHDSFPLPASPVTAWFRTRFRTPTPAQREAWPRIESGRNVLILSPTGSGKTLAAFLAILNRLAGEAGAGRLRDGIRAIYVSPLRALSYDLEKNLNEPLREIYGDVVPIRVALRTGDTSSAERQKQAARPPHLLLTTPESLMILLSQERWSTALARVDWVVVDEVHALAENKRGAHLSLSLERLEALRTRRWEPSGTPSERPQTLQRIGLSATVAPAAEVVRFLVGTHGIGDIVDTSVQKRIELKVYSPLGSDPYPPAGFTGARMIRELARVVRRHRTTLVFSNTRSGAEAATFYLRRALPDLADSIECHHASLDRSVRWEVEDRLKRGELRAVICSTSLELGIDIGSVDRVVMLATPKGVSRALQRTGRAGHDIHRTSRGLLMATNLNDLVECCATALLARRRHLDEVRMPSAPLDVLAQHLVSMGCVERWTREQALLLVRRAYVYRNLSDRDFEDVLEFLLGGGQALRRQYSQVFGKLEFDGSGYVTRRGTVTRDFLQNAGVIPDVGSVRVRCRARTLGTVEEGFMRGIQPGDVFMIAGRSVRLLRMEPLEAVVEPADHVAPTVPRWNANKMPLSNRVAAEIATFRTELRARLESTEVDVERDAHWIATRLECDARNAAIILRMHRVQQAVSEIPTADFLLVEEYVPPVGAGTDEQGAPLAVSHASRRRLRGTVRRPRGIEGAASPSGVRHYFVHSLIGRSANDALSRIVASRLGRLRGGNAVATPDDYGFVLTVSGEQVIRPEDLSGLFAKEGWEEDLRLGLRRSELLKYHFRNAAQTGMMIYRNYFGDRKPVRKLQWSAEVIFNVLVEHEPDHVLLREAWREAEHAFLDVDGAQRFLEKVATLPMRLRVVPLVAPLSFGMFVSRIREALMVEDPRETMERLFHLWWRRAAEAVPGIAIGGTAEIGDDAGNLGQHRD
ncbi:MAG: DEAD/DEAH box helicase [Verrucomicrobiales bacterium]|nr:DEAD/DEAH box helicase [Verrucomicrobiales bacterium]